MFVYAEHTRPPGTYLYQYLRVKSRTEAVVLVVDDECAVTKYVLRGLS